MVGLAPSANDERKRVKSIPRVNGKHKREREEDARDLIREIRKTDVPLKSKS